MFRRHKEGSGGSQGAPVNSTEANQSADRSLLAIELTPEMALQRIPNGELTRQGVAWQKPYGAGVVELRWDTTGGSNQTATLSLYDRRMATNISDHGMVLRVDGSIEFVAAKKGVVDVTTLSNKGVVDISSHPDLVYAAANPDRHILDARAKALIQIDQRLRY